MFATGETVGLAEWIIDDTIYSCLVTLFCFPLFLNALLGKPFIFILDEIKLQVMETR